MRGFTLAEVLLSIGILAMALVALFNLTGSAVRSSSKTENLAIAGDIAEQELNRLIYSAFADDPPGSRDEFWEQDWAGTPWRQGSARVNRTEFQYAIYVQTLDDAVTGDPVGTTSATSNRVKKVDIAVWWMTSGPSQDRRGYGRLSTGASRLVNEVAQP